MRKVDLVERLCTEHELGRREAKEFVELVLETIKEVTVRGERLKITGFGVFIPTVSKPRHGRNLKEKTVIEIPARRVVRFRASPALLDALNPPPPPRSASPREPG